MSHNSLPKVMHIADDSVQVDGEQAMSYNSLSQAMHTVGLDDDVPVDGEPAVSQSSLS